MRKMSLIITIMVLMATSVAAEGLAVEALAIKEMYPIGYQVIVDHAEQEWGSDYTMVVHQINKQTKANVECLGIWSSGGIDMQLWSDAYQKWSYEGSLAKNIDLLVAFFDNKTGWAGLLSADVDWEMIAYTYKKELAAKSAY